MDGLTVFRHLTVCFLFLNKWSLVNGQSISDGVDKVTELSNDLLPRLLITLAAQQPNVIVGPFGVASSLAILLEASDGETRQEILTALNVTDNDIVLLRIGFKAYCELFLAHSSNAEAAGTYNSAEIHSGITLKTTFTSILSQFYCSAVTANVTSGPALNLQSHSGVMAHWKSFEKLAVYTFLSHQDIRPFIRRDGISVPVPMIPQVGVFRTGVWENSRVIQLPLETNMVDLIIITPDEPKSINALIKEIRASSVAQMLNELTEEELEVFIPQLTSVSKHASLVPLLQSVGIHRAFSPQEAGLHQASNDSQPLYVNTITQDAFISTSFTSLSAVSGASSHFDVVSKRRKRSANKVYLTSPFIFLVVHKDTHLVLLAGKIEDPSQVPNAR